MPPEPCEEPRVEKLVPEERPRPVSDELARLVRQLQCEFPTAEEIGFEFIDKLRLHIDVRTLEEAKLVQARLPALCGGIFANYFHGEVPDHPFWHRISADAGA